MKNHNSTHACQQQQHTIPAAHCWRGFVFHQFSRSLLLALFMCLTFALPINAQRTVVRWSLSDNGNLEASTITGDEESLLTTSYLSGASIAKTEVMTGGNASDGFTAPTYDPPFTQFYVTTKQTGKTGGHNIAFAVNVPSGHTFKPTRLSFDAAKCGTDGGNFDVYTKIGATAETPLATAQVPKRNRVDATNPDGYSHHEYTISNVIANGVRFLVFIYIYNINGVDTSTPKSIAFRNVTIEGAIDEPIYTASHYLKGASFATKAGEHVDVTTLLSNLLDGQQAAYDKLLFGDPQDFQISTIDGYKAEVTYADKVATIRILTEDDAEVFRISVRFRVTYRTEKPAAKPLNRGLIAVNLSQNGGSGNLVSWRYREKDQNQVKFKLWRGTDATTQTTALNNGNYIYNRTNFRDATGKTSYYYRLEVYDLDDNLLETEISNKTWNNQCFEIPTKTPNDTRGLGATYTPNDAAFYDMDGDGEYEIVLKWDPSNSKDAADNGTTSDTYIDCYKMNGTQLWRINIGPNIRSGAHTTPFVVWDFDGDGYGELICKTAPGTVDGEGNYVVLPGDDPTALWINGRGKPDAGPEYVTVFDGLTGAELSTMTYHTKYGDVSTSFWGDSKQNRSERYLACVAYTDGVTPSAILCRGYYSGASLGAYDWDGMQLSRRWLHRSSTSGQGLWGEGAHFCIAGDVDDDGCDEIVYGAACLDNNGKRIVYRTGLGHGDALHLGDFDWDNPGMEVFMPHEGSPYGYELRDAKTGKLLVHQTAGGDTGRGLAADFDSANDGAELMASCTGALMDCKGKTIASSWAIGSSGAGINNRIYWDGDPYDEFFDKSVLAHWNATNKSFDRIKVNGSTYTPGTLNNYTKYNPCVLGDMLGDWREEIVTYNSSNNALIITTTDYESNYRLPHLMDNRQYAEAISNQNCAYNQPPHLPYDPARTHAIHVTIPENGLAPVYTEYSLQVPKGVVVQYVSNFNLEMDTLKFSRILNTIPAATGFFVRGVPGTEVTLKPASVNANAFAANKLRGDGILPVEVETTEGASYYQWGFREGLGWGYFRVESATIPTGEPYLYVSAENARSKEYFLVGYLSTAIEDITPDATPSDKAYTLSGRQATQQDRGIRIIGGKKVMQNP